LNLVEFVDAQLGRFLDRLEDDALLVVTSDHGEALGEDGQWGHQIDGMDLLYEVPLIVHGASSPLKQSESISHIDIHDWLRDTIAPTGSTRKRSERLNRRLEALGYIDGAHTV
jgi:arylsulfatase A-like enzyme